MAKRYEKEIDDILKQAGEIGSGKRGQGRGFFRLISLYLARSIGGPVRSLRPGRVMLIAVALLLLALIINTTASGAGVVAPIALAGLILFIVAYAMFFIRPPKRTGSEKRWRGQPIDDEQVSWWNKVRKKIE